MNNKKGFSLIELMVTLVIVAILFGVAYPSYHSYLIKTRRADGEVALLKLAAELENYSITQGSYQHATLAKLKQSDISPEGFYELKIIKTDNNYFLLAAIPIKSQAKDHECGVLTLDSLGEKKCQLNH